MGWRAGTCWGAGAGEGEGNTKCSGLFFVLGVLSKETNRRTTSGRIYHTDTSMSRHVKLLSRIGFNPLAVSARAMIDRRANQETISIDSILKCFDIM